LILADSKVDITSASLDAIIKGTKNTVNASWSVLIPRALEGKNVNDFFVGGSSSAAPAATSAPVA